MPRRPFWNELAGIHNLAKIVYDSLDITFGSTKEQFSSESRNDKNVPKKGAM